MKKTSIYLPLLKASDILLAFSNIITLQDSNANINPKYYQIIANNVYYFLLKKFYNENGELKNFIQSNIVTMQNKDIFNLKIKTEGVDILKLNDHTEENNIFLQNELIYIANLPEYKNFTSQDLHIDANDFAKKELDNTYYIPLSSIYNYLRKNHIYIAKIKEFNLKHKELDGYNFASIIFNISLPIDLNEEPEPINEKTHLPTKGYLFTSNSNIENIKYLEYKTATLLEPAKLGIYTNIKEE